MNKKSLSLGALLIAASLQSSAQQYQLSGQIGGIADGTTLVLVPMSHDREQPIDSATVQGGTFTFRGKVDFPRAVFLRPANSYGGRELMLENTSISVQGQATSTLADDQTPIYSMDKVSVTGSPLSQRLDHYIGLRTMLDSLYRATHEPFEAFWAKVHQARADKDSTLAAQLEASEEGRRANGEEKRFFDTVEKTYTGAIRENSDTYWGPLLALQYFTYFTSEQADMYNAFSDEAKASWYGQKVKSEVFPAGEVGEPAKSFSVKAQDGKVLTLADLAQGSTYLLVDFWASWCVPCRKEIPRVKAQYALYRDRGFKPISISIDRDLNAWRKAEQQEQLPWPSFHDDLGAADVYQVRAIPAMYLIDAKTMKVIASGEDARGEKLAAKLKELYR